MKKIVAITLITVGIINSLFSQDICDCPAQSKLGKGTMYFTWGYNKDWYTNSNIHFKNTSGEYNPVTKQIDNYDFTLYNLTARDHLGVEHLLTTPISIPQYGYRLGYFFNDKHDLGIEINFDHSKYIVNDFQTVLLKGTIRGVQYNQDTLVDPNKFMHFQHTNGANFLMVNMMKRQRLFVSKNKKHWLSGIAKVGAGIVIPRTFVTLWGEYSNNFWHIAGPCAGIETGLRYEAYKHFFLEYTAKGTYADYSDVLTIGSGRANHYFFAFENILSAGVQFPL